jgi:hypothetical protein
MGVCSWEMGDGSWLLVIELMIRWRWNFARSTEDTGFCDKAEQGKLKQMFSFPWDRATWSILLKFRSG